MKYMKPQISVLARAIEAVQGITKGPFPYHDSKPCTVNAYEADE